MRQRVALLVLWICFLGSSGRRTARDVECLKGSWLTQGNICCLNCPAGTHVKEVCTKAYERSMCQQCDFDTYTEHDNGLFMCLACTKCRSDQEVVERCNSTRNTRCQCKAGTYCLPDQACEVCKTCRKCKQDEEVVENCTAHANTVCRKRSSVSANTSTVAIISILAILMLILFLVIFLYWKTSNRFKKAVASRWPRKMCKWCIENGSDLVEVNHNSMNGAPEEGAQVQVLLVGKDMVEEEEEEDKGLGSSLSNTTASSQTSLPACTLTPEYCLSRTLPQQLNALEKNIIPRLVPLSDDSLRKSFDLFGDIDIDFHKRFFRLLGLSDNDIRTAEISWPLPGDRMYELLKIWMQKEGMKADFNSLIDALLTLDQRRSAENIVEKVVGCNNFRYEED